MKSRDRTKDLYREHMVLLAVVIVGIGVAAFLAIAYALWLFVDPQDVAQRTAFIQMVVGIVGGLTLVVGLLINFRGQRITQRNLSDNQKTQTENQRIALQQLDLTRRGQITERFTKAVEHLGDDKIEIRLGGIAALKQIADQEEASDQKIGSQEESSDRRWQIMEILTAYVRQRAEYKSNRRPNRRDEDIKAILQVIGDLTKRYGTHRGERYLSLANTDLMNLDLSGMHLQGVSLDIAHLEGAYLAETHLEGAYLSGAYLEGAYLGGAYLQGADLHGAHLQGAYLGGAKLAGANFGGADLLGATFPWAEFEAQLPTDGEEHPEWWSMLQDYKQEELKASSENGVVKAQLTQEMIKQINGDWSTGLPSDWSTPVWWSTLLSSLPNYQAALIPGEYHIKLGNIPMSFSVDEGWQSDLEQTMPYAFSLTLSGSATAGSIVTFQYVDSVVDPDKFRKVLDPEEPGEYAAAVSAKPPDLFRWCSEHWRAYLDIGKEEEVQPPIGDASGVQFEASVIRGKGIKGVPGAHGPIMPTFPMVNLREHPSFLVEGHKNLIIILNVAGEMMIITVMSPESEFEEFCEKTRKVLDTVSWLTPEP